MGLEGGAEGELGEARRPEHPTDFCDGAAGGEPKCG